MGGHGFLCESHLLSCPCPADADSVSDADRREWAVSRPSPHKTRPLGLEGEQRPNRAVPSWALDREGVHKLVLCCSGRPRTEGHSSQVLPRMKLMQGRAVGENAGKAVLDGGPLDGREHPVESNTAELLVVMADGARHLYVASDRQQARPDGRVVPVFEYRGRE